MTRIVAGASRGMSLKAPKGNLTRPTSDRVKEALFSAIASWLNTADRSSEEQLSGIRVLDLFAGSGALGLEAASRGAERVVAVDRHTGAVIRSNAKRTGLRLEVLPGTASTALASLEGEFDLVLADPPYDMPSGALSQLVVGLADDGHLSSRALVVVERPKRAEPLATDERFTSSWQRSYGDTTLYFHALYPKE